MSNKTTKGLMLRSAEGVLVQTALFVLQLVLARILVPEDFGIVAILGTFISIANTMVNSGLSSALLQKKEITQTDICTVFYIELGVALVMYCVIFVAAPGIAAFYENEALTGYLRVSGLNVVLGGASSIQLTVSRYRLDFKPSLIASCAGVLAQAVTGITMALNGWGVWSLIMGNVLYYSVRSVVLIALVRWVPSLKFSYKSFKTMFSYSWKLFAGWMIGTLYQDVFSWIIGKKYDSTTLGYYSKGNSIPALINRVVTQVTTAVMFPSVAKHQDDIVQVKQQTRLMISISAALIMPIMAGVAGAADSLVYIILTEKWLPAVPVIQIMSIPLALNVLGNANMQSYNAIGRSDLFLRFEMIKRASTIVLVLICMNIDYYLMLAAIGVGGVIALTINAVYNRKLLGYSYGEYLADIVPYLVFSLALFVGVNALNMLQVSVIVRFVLQLMLCAAAYLTMIFTGALPAFREVRKMLLSIIKKKK